MFLFIVIFVAGKLNVKIGPRWMIIFTDITPPCASTIDLHNDKPSPINFLTINNRMIYSIEFFKILFLSISFIPLPLSHTNIHIIFYLISVYRNG